IQDFAISSANLGPYVLGLSFTATMLSSSTFLGYPGWSYSWGYSILWVFIGLVGMALIVFIIMGKIICEVNITQQSLSLPDWIGDYFDSNVLRVGTSLVMLFIIFNIASQLSAGAQVFTTMLDLNYVVGLIIITLIVVAYVFFGGSYADIYTDALQAALM